MVVGFPSVQLKALVMDLIHNVDVVEGLIANKYDMACQ